MNGWLRFATDSRVLKELLQVTTVIQASMLRRRLSQPSVERFFDQKSKPTIRLGISIERRHRLLKGDQCGAGKGGCFIHVLLRITHFIRTISGREFSTQRKCPRRRLSMTGRTRADGSSCLGQDFLIATCANQTLPVVCISFVKKNLAAYIKHQSGGPNRSFAHHRNVGNLRCRCKTGSTSSPFGALLSRDTPQNPARFWVRTARRNSSVLCEVGTSAPTTRVAALPNSPTEKQSGCGAGLADHPQQPLDAREICWSLVAGVASAIDRGASSTRAGE